MQFSHPMAPNRRTDAELVGDTLAGNRNSFAEIVSRYQILVCSLAYSATGDLARSEDLAQETFIAVWQELAKLREPEKLRAWVCSIARHRIQDSFRRHYREPVFKAESLDHASAAPTGEAQPSDQAVREDEVAIMWRALEQIPEIYREPLILFHRENQSVERVATELDLTEDAVKQRLVRGRKLLQAEVEKVVEGTLRRTAPGSVFTSSVLGALPITGTTAIKAAIVSAGAKGLFGVGVARIATELLSSPLPFVGTLLLERKRMQAQEAAAVSIDERDLLANHRRTVLRLLAGACVILTFWAQWFKKLDHPVWFAPLLPLAVVPLMVGVLSRIVATRRDLARIWILRGETPIKRSWEYCSQWQPLGLPFVHIRFGFNPHWPAADRAVKAWIAIGQVAYGRLFAFGIVAMAPISLGAVAIGIGSIGCCALGAVGLGGIAVGRYVVGLAAFGWMAAGGIALGLHAAYGFAAYAGNFAQCLSEPKPWAAYAAHANDAIAHEFFATNEFFARTIPFFHTGQRLAGILFLAASPLALWEIVWEIMKGRRELITRAKNKTTS